MPVETEIKKDEILELLINNPSIKNKEQLSQSLKIDIDITYFLVSEIENDKYVKSIRIGSDSVEIIIQKEGKGFYKSIGYEKQYTEKKLQLQKLQLEIDSLVNTLVDYNKVKERAKWAIIISVALLLLKVIELLV